MRSAEVLGLIGGSAIDAMPGFAEEHALARTTPWGEASAPVRVGTLHGARVLWLARHGEGQPIAPHRIDYRANLHALKDAGATLLIALHAVGGIAAAASPASLWLPEQIIDYSWGRAGSFHDGERQPLAHLEFAEPFDHALRMRILGCARRCGIALHDGGVYGCTQGPRLETAAEIRRMQRDGCDLVGMTAMPEAALARELGLPYASLSMVVNRAAGQSTEPITMEGIRSVAAECVATVARLIAAFCSGD